jgi:hypothetical protein
VKPESSDHQSPSGRGGRGGGISGHRVARGSPATTSSSGGSDHSGATSHSHSHTSRRGGRSSHRETSPPVSIYDEPSALDPDEPTYSRRGGGHVMQQPHQAATATAGPGGTATASNVDHVSIVEQIFVKKPVSCNSLLSFSFFLFNPLLSFTWNQCSICLL